MNVRNVERPSFTPQAFEDTCECTQERNPTSVNSAGKPLVFAALSKDMRELTVKRNILNASSVGKALLCPHP